MTTIKIDGAIWARKYTWDRDYHFTWSCLSDPDDRHMRKDGGVYIAPYTIEIEVDGNVEKMLHQKSLKALQKERRLILAENQKRLDEIDERIARHMAIEHKQEGEA